MTTSWMGLVRTACSPVWRMAPMSCNVLTISSTKKGFPSARWAIRVWSAAGRLSVASNACAIWTLSVVDKCRQGDPGVVGTFLKGVDIPGAVGQETEHPGAGKTVREERQKCLGGLIHPLQILEDHDLWAHCRSAHDDVPHGVKDLATALLRVHAWHQWAWINGKEVVQIRQDVDAGLLRD